MNKFVYEEIMGTNIIWAGKKLIWLRKQIRVRKNKGNEKNQDTKTIWVRKKWVQIKIWVQKNLGTK